MSTVAEEIIKGTYDNELENIRSAVNTRRKQLAEITFIQLNKNDRIEIVGNVDPQYLKGVQGTVVRPLRKNILVHIDDVKAARRFRDTELRIPPTLLKVVE